MEQQVAETIVRASREEAELQAREDLDQLRRRAIGAGRERSRKVIKVTVINTSTGGISYNPAGRLLRDWYLHVYINSLRANLSQPSEIVDTQQVEEVSAMISRLRPTESRQAREAVGTTQKIAVADADAAAARITERLHEAGASRAIRHAPDERFDGDQLRVHIARHWYQRCYDDTVDEAVRARHPLAAVTDAEMLQVATTLTNHEVRRLIGRDSIPLVTAHGTAMNDLDRRLAAGQAGVAITPPFETPSGEASDGLAKRVSQAWSDMDQEMRGEWLRLAGAPSAPTRPDWVSLRGGYQTKLVQHYFKTHRLELLYTDFERPRIEGAPAEVARKMFSHSRPLTPRLATADQELAPAHIDLAGLGTLTDPRSRDFSLQADDQGSPVRRVQ